jgi:hypothetical protein
MVRAIIAGKKTQTRRVIKPQPHVTSCDLQTSPELVDGLIKAAWTALEVKCPYGQNGDRLWVRETWAHDAESLEQLRAQVEDPLGFPDGPYYRAALGIHENTGLRWRPSIHMPRWASRLTLEIDEVRVERLHEIDAHEVRAEGIRVPTCGCEVCMRSATMCPADESAHLMQFATLWDAINRKKYPWESNPWVWVLRFHEVYGEGETDGRF